MKEKDWHDAIRRRIADNVNKRTNLTDEQKRRVIEEETNKEIAATLRMTLGDGEIPDPTP
jgi:hypothetical protein